MIAIYDIKYNRIHDEDGSDLMDVLDNKLKKFGDDLKQELKAGDKCNIASAVFSMYSYQELKKQLNTIEEFNFIFTNPTFIKEKKSCWF